MHYILYFSVLSKVVGIYYWSLQIIVEGSMVVILFLFLWPGITWTECAPAGLSASTLTTTWLTQTKRHCHASTSTQGHAHTVTIAGGFEPWECNSTVDVSIIQIELLSNFFELFTALSYLTWLKLMFGKVIFWNISGSVTANRSLRSTRMSPSSNRRRRRTHNYQHLQQCWHQLPLTLSLAEGMDNISFLFCSLFSGSRSYFAGREGKWMIAYIFTQRIIEGMSRAEKFRKKIELKNCWF